MRLFLIAAMMMGLAAPGVAQDPGPIASALNAQRTAHGLPPLSVNPRLSDAALQHARDMAANGFLAHRGSDGSRLRDRVARTGYCYSHVSENLAWGRLDAAEVLALWMQSTGHRRNILNSRSREFGAALTGGVYWVLVLGRPC